ncbi:Major Facilitator Superfamily protein [Tardiphaga sp. OK245]|nr:MFS transporter [Tardiphaga sp. OK245]SEI23359.1 Major Facilitator Superfamily protein [Tardiphaga sp. OK245]
MDSVTASGRRSHHPLCAVGAVLIGSFLVGFQTRLFSIGLADLKGHFSLSFDEGAWLSTAANAPQILIAPAVVWLAVTFGVRRILCLPSLVFALICTIIPFVRDFETLLVLHVLQALLLGLFIPATIIVILRNLPQRWWLPALAIYAFRSAFTSNFGVSLVGSYVQNLGWEWLYWQGTILAPIMGLFAYFGAPDEPVSRDALTRADWGGMILLGSGLALVYVGLDQGNRLDWSSSGIVMATLAGGLALIVAFFINESVIAEPWASARVLMSRNLILLFATTTLFLLSSQSNSLLLPNFLTVVAALRPEQMGPLFVNYVAIPLFVLTIIAVLLLRRIDARIVLAMGLTAFACAALLGTTLTQQWRLVDFEVLALFQAIGHAFTFISIIVFTFANVDRTKAVAAAAYIQVLRLGSAELGLALLSTWLRIREQIHSHYLGQHVASGDSVVVKRLAQLKAHFAPDFTGAAAKRSLSALATTIQKEAYTLAYIDGFWLSFWAAIGALLLVAMMKAAQPGPFTPTPSPRHGRDAANRNRRAS